MKIGIIGLPRSGKTSLFTALVGEGLRKEEQTHQRFIVQLGTTKLKDSRLQYLAKVFGSKKVTFSEMVLFDLLLHGETEREWFESSIFREVDCLVGVLRCFMNAAVPAYQGKVDPLRDLKSIETELILRDLQSVQNRIYRLEGDIKKGKKDEEKELGLLRKISQHLEQGNALRKFVLESQEEKLIRGFKLLSQKPIFFVLNLDEERAFGEIETVKESMDQGEYKSMLALLKLEVELGALEEVERFSFLNTFGFKEPLKERFLSACLNFLDLVTFFTVKGEEAKAWLVDENTPALKAAGKIHSDMERGFIRAEVINYNDFINVGSSLSEAKKKGLLRLESKEYIVRDGDIIDFRFAV